MDRPIRFGILTVSDRSARGERPDRSGPALAAAVERHGGSVVETRILPDEREVLEAYFRETAKRTGVDVLLTTGGTGFAPRDVTPEATAAVIERPAPGLAEVIRAESIRITPHGMLSRGAAGIIARMLIVNLSGSPKAAVEQFEVIAPVLQHAVDLLRDDPGAEAGH